MDKIEKLKKDFDELLNSSFKTWEEVKRLKKIIRVYLIYYKNKIIYIGSTNNFNVRFGIDLKHKSTHTLHNKLLKENKTPEEIIEFLTNKCEYRIRECEDKLKAEALEHFAIWIIKPKYNKYIYEN